MQNKSWGIPKNTSTFYLYTPTFNKEPFCLATLLYHTFITRCQEVRIRREIVSLWAGHVADTSITTTVYTHLEQNEQIQRDEISKFNYILN